MYRRNSVLVSNRVSVFFFRIKIYLHVSKNSSRAESMDLSTSGAEDAFSMTVKLKCPSRVNPTYKRTKNESSRTKSMHSCYQHLELVHFSVAFHRVTAGVRGILGTVLFVLCCLSVCSAVCIPHEKKTCRSRRLLYTDLCCLRKNTANGGNIRCRSRRPR